MITIQEIAEYIEETLQGSQYFLVGVMPLEDNGFEVLIDSEQPVDIEYCVHLSGKLHEHFGTLMDEYDLQIGSAGLTSPLRVPRQYRKYIDKEVETLTLDGQKLHGTLLEADDEGFVLGIERKVKKEGEKKPSIITEQVAIPYKNIKYTKYLLQF